MHSLHLHAGVVLVILGMLMLAPMCKNHDYLRYCCPFLAGTLVKRLVSVPQVGAVVDHGSKNVVKRIHQCVEMRDKEPDLCHSALVVLYPHKLPLGLWPQC